ncbi:EthD family reductase [Gordonia sp. NPDC003376]
MNKQYKVVGLWSAPQDADIDDFEEHYATTHVPLAAAVPGLQKITLTRAEAGLGGSAPACYRLAEMYFDSPESMAAGFGSPEGHAMHEDAQGMIGRFGVSMQALAGWEH